MDASNHTPDLAVAITAFNSMRTIERALESVRGLARRVVVVDSGSTDGTPERCRELGAEVVHHPWSGYGEQKRISIAQCAGHEWILVLDSDESLEPRLRESLQSALAKPDASAAGYEVNRKIWFLGGWLNHTFQPEWRLRLFRAGQGRVVGDLHEAIVVDGMSRRLAGDLRHDSFRDMGDMLRRHLNYASVLAAQGGRGGTTFRILVSPSAAFIKQLLLRRGILDGWRGVLAAGGMAACALMKHLLLAQQRHFGSVGDDRSGA